jgi:hypothetical protein
MKPILVSSQTEEEFKAKQAREAELIRARLGGRGGGPTGEDMERRVTALEKALEKSDLKLDKLIENGHATDLRLESRFSGIDVKLTSVDVKLDAKASGSSVAEIKGHISDLPTKWFVATTAIAVLFGASALISAVLIYLEKIRALVGAH